MAEQTPRLDGRKCRLGVPASSDERRYAVFDVAKYAQGAGSDSERRSYFNALHHEIENGGLEAILYDLLRRDLGEWHPRQIYETEGLRKQKEQKREIQSIHCH